MRVSSRAPVWGASWADMVLFANYKFQVVPPCGGHRGGPGKKRRRRRFQVVPPCGGHQASEAKLCRSPCVSSRAPVWGASVAASPQGDVEMFQVVPPCGGHQAILVEKGKGGEFQVVPPCGGHPIILSLIRPGMMFQVVPPCGGHRPALAESFDFNAVSSRAPVWGASRSRAFLIHSV